MANVRSRAEPSGSLSSTAIIAIVSAVGVVILGLLAALVLLLIRAVRRHKQILAEIDERGMTITQAQKEAKTHEVTRPRAVLRRNTILPFNSKSGWGALPSVETIGSAAPSTGSNAPDHYVPHMPIVPNKRTSSLSWPFHQRKSSGHSLKMKKLKANRLSAVLEDPKPSSLVPILGKGQSRPPLALLMEYGSEPSSCQSLLRYHPAFRNQHDDVAEYATLEISKRPQRAKSVTEVPLETERVHIRQRSTSLHSQASGKAPDVILPPLPFDIARIKDEAQKKCELRHVPSRTSISSVGSIDSSILNPRPSPVPQSSQSSHARTPKITKRERRNNAPDRMNPLLEAREKIATASPEARREFYENSTALPTESSNHTLGSEHTLGSVGSVKKAESVTVSRVVSASATPSRTPKRRSKTLVTSTGSPKKDCPIGPAPRLTTKSPKRQTSRASSRSSCGNPFQWDPAPLTATGRPPSALKGSPSARQGHRRGHSVRISLVPTVHPIRGRNNSPVFMSEDEQWFHTRAQQHSPTRANNRAQQHSPTRGNTRSSPAPPSSATFAPELPFATTTLKASLTPTSASLPLVNFDQTFVVAPTDQVLPELSEREQSRLSTGSVFSLSRFPLPLSVIEPEDDTVIHIPDHTFGLPVPETPYLQQYPFRTGTSARQSPSPSSLIDLDEYDPGQPGLGFQTPTNVAPRAYPSACTTIPEESSVGSKATLERSTPVCDSPPVSPKTVSPPRFTLNAQYTLPIHATTIPEEESPRTINPAVLTRDAFALAPASPPRRLSYTPGTADAPTCRPLPSPLSSPLSSPLYPSPASPRPAHASLPQPLPPLSLNFSAIPHLAPAPVRTSILALRRMNSDAEDARRQRAGRGERRYLLLGEGERGSVDRFSVEGNATEVDELLAYEDTHLDDDEVRRLVGSVLEWDSDASDAAILDLDEQYTPRAAAALGGGRGVTVANGLQSTSPSDASGGAEASLSSIWDESDAFWASSTPPPDVRSDQHSACNEASKPNSTTATPKRRKRAFHVPLDPPSSPYSPCTPHEQESPSLGGKKQRDSGSAAFGSAARSDRKRSVLGRGAPNVNAGVNAGASPGVRTPGSWYDEEGFLR
ncbi:hypothetical protein C7974DRAFT_353091 [Boeremia exigua]|uniref:uncharacterized protein n=1 Tax=Boeremia exigua TaxID=749465 RepID=UPI001E8D3F04|nr:uncharacterized protein C7974DRAFT_353091 [Boeremia exigua]KAH6638950.1 hypothetical protein C7974DRAFT_353091 [Boeremia exigua]